MMSFARALKFAPVLCAALAAFAARAVETGSQFADRDWPNSGRTNAEQRFSPLAQIDKSSVSRLGLAWTYEFDTDRGQEATPLVVDGVLYTTTAWSKIFAFEAPSGKLLWSYDPEVPGIAGYKACCDVVNRGPAYLDGRLFAGTLDGRLIALDAKTGKLIWSVMTVDPDGMYTITGAPRIARGRVIIGNGGADFGARGYVTAYDAATGAQAWRFYTVPGDPSKPFENEALERAAATWSGRWWEKGGGGTVWDSIAYDAELNLVYIGVGNGYPYLASERSPEGGDNLFLSSIVALNPETGAYVWHYQTTPSESWDFTATQHMILADLTIGGRLRKVLMQAPKNGFFYVLDRASGELLAARNYVPTNWASHVDMATGRPVENTDYFRAHIFESLPSLYGGHNWHPMAYSPATGLVYLPIHVLPLGAMEGGTKPASGGPGLTQPPSSGALIAWDPVAMKEVWRYKLDFPSNGGVLATAGGLVFQGNAAGTFAAYDQSTGARLWAYDSKSGFMAAPISFAAGAEQYIAVMQGYGGGAGVNLGGDVPRRPRLPGRLLVFKLDGAAPAPVDAWDEPKPLDLAQADPAGDAAVGKPVYEVNCQRCHGQDGRPGILPDLRYSPAIADAPMWKAIVLDGAFEQNGMIGFAAKLNANQAEDVRAYVLDLAKAAAEPK
jgi:quinohemoprotein ethanol dehydrogenase